MMSNEGQLQSVTGLLRKSDKQKSPFNAVARRIKATLDSPIYCHGRFYQYEGGVWHPLDQDEVEQHIKSALGDYYTVHTGAETLRSLQLDCRISPEQLNHQKLLFNLRNGMLDLSILSLRPHDRSDYFTIQLPVSYSREARCPRWRRFLQELWEHDPDRREKINFIQEWVGYLLTQDTTQHRCVICLGAGSNGKSTLMDVLLALLGQANVSAVSLQQLKNPNYLAELHGKLLNASSESGTGFFRHTNILKQIVAGEPIYCDRKYEHPFSFRPYSRMMFAMNELPTVDDHSHGFFRRLVILEFNQRFEGKADDKCLKEKLLTELDGILLWALKGLKRLQQQKRLSVPASSQERVRRYREETNSALSFLAECCAVENVAQMRGGQLYAQYRSWTRTNGYVPVSNGRFAEQLMARFGDAVTKSRDAQGVLYQGIRLLPGSGGAVPASDPPV